MSLRMKMTSAIKAGYIVYHVSDKCDKGKSLFFSVISSIKNSRDLFKWESRK